MGEVGSGGERKKEALQSISNTLSVVCMLNNIYKDNFCKPVKKVLLHSINKKH